MLVVASVEDTDAFAGRKRARITLFRARILLNRVVLRRDAEGLRG